MSPAWRNAIPYPYKGLDDPKYLKDRERTEKRTGNGWWWNDGKGWDPEAESPMLRQRRYKKEKEK